MDHPQPDISIRRYDNVYVSDNARAVVGDSHYHIQIRDDQLESDDILGKVDVSEIQTVSSLAWKLYKSCKSDPDAFSNISQDLSALRAVLEECEEIFPHVTKPPKRAQRLKTIVDGCNDNLGQLEAIVVRYNNLAVRQRWTWQRMGECSLELQEIRGRITSQMTMLTAFMSTSQFYVEQRLEEMRREFQEGHLEGSVISTLTIDSLTADARAEWRVIRKELENHGISLAMFDANKDFIYHWIERAVKRGAFEERGQLDMDDKGSNMKTFVNNDVLTDSEDDSGNDPSGLKSSQTVAGSSRALGEEGRPKIGDKSYYMEKSFDNLDLTDSEDDSGDDLRGLEYSQSAAGSSTAFERRHDPPQPQGSITTPTRYYGQRSITTGMGGDVVHQILTPLSHDDRADYPRHPGTLKALFSSSITTSKPPQFIRQEIIRVLNLVNCGYDEVLGRFICRRFPRIPTPVMLKFEINVVKIRLFSLHGIQFKRLPVGRNERWRKQEIEEYREITSEIRYGLQL